MGSGTFCALCWGHARSPARSHRCVSAPARRASRRVATGHGAASSFPDYSGFVMGGHPAYPVVVAGEASRICGSSWWTIAWPSRPSRWWWRCSCVADNSKRWAWPWYAAWVQAERKCPGAVAVVTPAAVGGAVGGVGLPISYHPSFRFSTRWSWARSPDPAHHRRGGGSAAAGPDDAVGDGSRAWANRAKAVGRAALPRRWQTFDSDLRQMTMLNGSGRLSDEPARRALEEEMRERRLEDYKFPPDAPGHPEGPRRRVAWSRAGRSGCKASARRWWRCSRRAGSR